MIEIVDKMHQHSKSKLPRKLFGPEKYITLETETAKKLRVFHRNCSIFARKIPIPSKLLERFF